MVFSFHDIKCVGGPQPSAIPGNIGTLNSKVMVWDHDPIWARPTQIMSWPFSKETGEQLDEPVLNIEFEANGAFLKPVYVNHDMFVCTRNSDLDLRTGSPADADDKTTIDPTVDLVGGPLSGVGHLAESKLPGGNIFECDANRSGSGKCTIEDEDIGATVVLPIDPTTGKSMFSHQLWKHIGNIFSNKVFVHPSEYNKNSEDSVINKRITDVRQFSSAARWDYAEKINNGRATIWPKMMVKKSDDNEAVHWTLEKWTPVWQGQDFFVTVSFENGSTDDTVDPNDSSQIRTEINEYKYLMYDVDTPPEGDAFFRPGISNQAFHISPEKEQGIVSSEAQAKANAAARQVFDWRYKTYLLIEIGVGDSDHNYFIEIVKGRKPRLLHLGTEWDNPERLINASADFQDMQKCRELDEFSGVSSDQLFSEKEFRVTVRNHLGRFVITFEGHEDKPWEITRFDNDRTKTDGTKKLVPMVVPSSPIRIHGGNLPVAINYSPLQYSPNATIPFTNRQIDSKDAENKDIYITFSHMGNSVKYFKPSMKKRFFNDDRFDFYKVGYDCDAYLVKEYLKNSETRIKIYEEYVSQFKIHGKGWFFKTPRDPDNEADPELDENGLAVDAKFINGMSEKEGRPSVLSIVNLGTQSKNFPLTLRGDPLAAGVPDEIQDFSARWDVGVRLTAGSIRMPSPTGPDALPIDPSGVVSPLFENYITPIATSWRIFVLGGSKPFKGNAAAIPFDISPLVQKITDSWSSEDFYSINHEMKMECYIPIESTVSTNPTSSTTEERNLYNLGRKIKNLHNKNFYLTVSYWWDTGIGHRGVIGNRTNIPGKDPNNNDLLIQMTGVGYGATFTRSNNRLIMSFDIKDYRKILSDQKIFNSPFFDAVQDVQAVYDLAKMAGFEDPSNIPSGIDRRPLGFLRKVLKDGDRIGESKFIYNGEEVRSERYDLPGSFATLLEPAVRYQDGRSYEEAIQEIAQQSGKAFYFDRWGVLRLETMPAISAAFASANENLEFKPVFDFVSTPIRRKSNIPDSGSGGETKSFVFDADFHAAHLVYNSLTYQRSVEDAVNQIILLGISNEEKLADGSVVGGFLIQGHTFFEQIWNPEVEGFIGYRKPFYQAEGAFGSAEAIRNGIAQYAKMKFPPVIMSFETYGVPGLKALDIISLDGNLAYITEISHDLDPSTNRWWMNIQAEWLKPFKGELGFLEATEQATGTNDGNGVGN